MEQNQLCTLTVAKTLSRLWMGRTLGMIAPRCQDKLGESPQILAPLESLSGHLD